MSGLLVICRVGDSARRAVILSGTEVRAGTPCPSVLSVYRDSEAVESRCSPDSGANCNGYLSDWEGWWEV